MIKRKFTKVISCGGVKIGGDNPVVIQSMTNTKTRDVDSTVSQILRLEEAGCQIVRLGIPDRESALALREIKSRIHIPLIADIHFDYKLALLSMENGADGIRINPGNIGSNDRVKEVIEGAKRHNCVIRIGVNLGSLNKDIEAKFGRTSKAMVESALEHIRFFEQNDFTNIKISLKASDIFTTIEAYEEFSRVSDYPVHVGVTEAGTFISGTVKSSIGIGYLLLRGIGDTIRVSLTADPVEEVRVARMILGDLGLVERPIVISCPTCARTQIDLIPIAQKVENYALGLNKNIKIAVMGCAVNGPGEAKDADIGIAGGQGKAIIFKKGEIIKTVSEEDIFDELIKEIESM